MLLACILCCAGSDCFIRTVKCFQVEYMLLFITNTINIYFSSVFFSFGEREREKKSFTSRKLQVSAETMLFFFQQFDRGSYVSRTRVLGLFLFCLFWHLTTWFKCRCWRTDQITVLSVAYPIVWLSSGKIMVSIFHLDLISCQYF